MNPTMIGWSTSTPFTPTAGVPPDWCNFDGITCDLGFESPTYGSVTKIFARGGATVDGTIPSSIDKLVNLREIRLIDLKLVGTIPASFFTLEYVCHIVFFSNSLTGTIPDALGAMTHLRLIDMSSNQLTGSIPASIGFLTQLNSLYLFDNRLSLTISGSLASLSSLELLSLHDNRLTGTIPPTIGLSTNLLALTLNNNILTGTIPPSISSLINLQDLWLYQNDLDGTIPNLSLLTALTYLELHDNYLTMGLESSVPLSTFSAATLTSFFIEDSNLYNNCLEFVHGGTRVSPTHCRGGSTATRCKYK